MKPCWDNSWDSVKRALRSLQKKGYFTSLTPMCHCKMPIAASPKWTVSDRMVRKAPLPRPLPPGYYSDCLLPKMPQDCWRRAILLESVSYFFDLLDPEWDEAYFAWNGNAKVIMDTFTDNHLFARRDIPVKGLMTVEFDGNAFSRDARLVKRINWEEDGTCQLSSADARFMNELGIIW